MSTLLGVIALVFWIDRSFAVGKYQDGQEQRSSATLALTSRTEGTIRMAKPKSTTAQRTVLFLSFVSPEPNSGCWLWLGATTTPGYGKFYDGNRAVHAHRWIYELLHGVVDEKLDLDHLCRVRCCVNPDHVEPVTRSENINRGQGPRLSRERQLVKTHCPWGHPYDEVNTRIYVYPSGKKQRLCRICQNAPRGRVRT